MRDARVSQKILLMIVFGYFSLFLCLQKGSGIFHIKNKLLLEFLSKPYKYWCFFERNLGDREKYNWIDVCYLFVSGAVNLGREKYFS